MESSEFTINQLNNNEFQDNFFIDPRFMQDIKNNNQE